MKSNTSLHRLLVGSAAIIIVTAGAQAADLPSRKAEPVQYVRICDAYGAGFFYIPGTDTCLRVGGYVRAEFEYAPAEKIYSASTGLVTQVPGDIDTTGMEFRGRVKLDARTQTQWGTVQTIVQLRGTNSDGIRATASAGDFQTAYAPAGNKSSSLTMERAYIRFAGITAGLQDETFENVPGPAYFFTGNNTSGFSNGVKALKYTAIFGDFTWENAIESRGDFAYDNDGSSLVGPSKVSTFTNSTYVNHPDTGYNLVSTLTFTQSWGHAAISGAVGNNSVAPVGNKDANNTLLGPQKYGSWAIGGEVDIKLPFIAPGDEFFINAAYGDLLGEIAGGPVQNTFGANSPNKRVTGGVIRADSLLTPTIVDSSGNPLAYGSNYGFETFASYTHYWNPQWRSNLGVGYVVITPATAHCSTVSSGACVEDGGLNTQWGTGTTLTVQGNVIWSPAKDFDIGLEEEWGDMRNKLQNPNSTYVAAGSPGLNETGWVTKLRLQRSF